MAYTINLSNGSSLIPGGLSDGSIDLNHTSLVLIGKDYAGYGQYLNENFVYLLENFANNASPANPLRGQLWWDTANNILRVYSGTSWKISTGATSGPATQPPGDLSTLGGDLWYDTTNAQLKVYTGSNWIVVGPQATAATGNTGAVPAIMTDTTSGNHVVVQIIINGTVYAVISKDTFASNLTGFPLIKAGFNFSNAAVPAWQFNNIGDLNAGAITGTTGTFSGAITGTAITGTTGTFSGAITSTSATIGAVSGTNGTFSGAITGAAITGTTGTFSGAITGTSAAISGAISGTSGTFTGNIIAANIIISGGSLSTTGNVNASGVFNGSGAGLTNIPNSALINRTITINGVAVALGGNITLAQGGVTSVTGTTNQITASASTGAITLSLPQNIHTGANPTFAGLISSGDLIPSANLTQNIGSTTAWWNNIYGTAIHAQYADLAERFEADQPLMPGTVVELGGAAEITSVGADLSENVFGVISTRAAYLMNSQAGSDQTHPPVAVQGRVPVRVIGKVRKGDRLVSAGAGLARAGGRGEINTWNVIGRALANNVIPGEGLVEAVVKLNS